MNKSVFSLLVLLVIYNSRCVNAQNCSTFNPCGNRGYCIDNDNQTKNGSTCDCKFWWEGPTCEIQSATGKEVIALGVVTGVVILFYHVLDIIWSLIKKRKKAKSNKTDYEIESSIKNVVESTEVTYSKGFCYTSLLICFLMAILTVIALIIRWILLQKIHDDIVNKYNQKVPIYYVPNNFCSYVIDQSLNIFTFPAACVIIIMFAIISKRASFKQELCHGYIAPIIPLNFFAHMKRTFVSAVFTIASNHLLVIILEAFRQERTRRNGSIIQYLKNIALVFVICICYYPMLAGVYIGNIFTLTCAMLYTWLYFTITVLHQGYCPEPVYPTESDYKQSNSSADIIKYLTYYGTGPDLVIYQLCVDIPRYLCLSYLSIRLPIMLISSIRNYQRDKENIYTRDEEPLFNIAQPDSVETLYVKRLFNSTNIAYSTNRSFFARFIPKFIYEWRDDFCFSSRISCIFGALFLALFVITVNLLVQELPDMPKWQLIIQSLTGSFTSNLVGTQGNTTGQNPASPTSVSAVKAPFIIAVFTALFITVIQLFVLLTRIRLHLLQLFRGDHSEILERDKSKNLSYATGDLHFAGFVIGYAIWGYILCFFLSFLIYYIFGKLVKNDGKLFESFLKVLIPVLILSMFKVYLNMFIVKYILLYGNDEILAIRNHRLSMIILYFNFFLDAFLGLAASFTRIVTSIGTTIVFMARLDYSPLGRQREFSDAGFCAYTGFIHMEAIHRNPIMLKFISILLISLRTKTFTRSSKAHRRWHLAKVLIHNPSLVIWRKTILAQKQRNLMALQSMNVNFDKELKAMLRCEYASHGPISSNSINPIELKL